MTTHGPLFKTKAVRGRCISIASCWLPGQISFPAFYGRTSLCIAQCRHYCPNTRSALDSDSSSLPSGLGTPFPPHPVCSSMFYQQGLPRNALSHHEPLSTGRLQVKCHNKGTTRCLHCDVWFLPGQSRTKGILGARTVLYHMAIWGTKLPTSHPLG